MSKIALAFLTRDRVDLSEQTVESLLGLPDVDLFWIDGSSSQEGKDLPSKIAMQQPSGHRIKIHSGVRGGPDAAVAYALTTMLKGTDYHYVGLVENDVLLPAGWLAPTMALFQRGWAEGLGVGAVSTRCYEDRILTQRDGYAVIHNAGWGQVIMTAYAARLALTKMRTSFTTDNRRVFAQLAGVDIAKWWAFRGDEHPLCADWGNDRLLASHGFASLALTPSPVRMIGQNPPLHEQGLKIADTVELLRADGVFSTFAERTAKVRQRHLALPQSIPLVDPSGAKTYLPHQMGLLDAKYAGLWKLRFNQAHGPFLWEAQEIPNGVPHKAMGVLTVPVAGPCEFLVSGGKEGGKVQVTDHASGYDLSPDLLPEGPSSQVMALAVPASVAYREITLRALTPGVTFWGLRVHSSQPENPNFQFDWHYLPRA